MPILNDDINVNVQDCIAKRREVVSEIQALKLQCNVKSAMELLNNEKFYTLVDNNLRNRYEAFIKYDHQVMMITERRMPAVNDLQSMGLIYDLGSIGVAQSAYAKMGEFIEASTSMKLSDYSDKDNVEYEYTRVPIPFIKSRWSLDDAEHMASQLVGGNLSMDNLSMATRAVAEKIERILFNGDTVMHEGQALYGYLNHPNIRNVTLTATWDTVATRTIVDDFMNMYSEMFTQRFMGPYILYVASNVYTSLLEDYKAETKGSFMDYIMEKPNMKAVKASDFLPDGQVVMVNMDRETIDMAVAQGVVNLEVPYRLFGSTDYLVYAKMAPRVKVSIDGRCGVVVGKVA